MTEKSSLELEKVFPEIAFKRYLLERLLLFNSGLAELFRIERLRSAEAPTKKMEVISSAVEIYFCLKARIDLKKRTDITEIVDPILYDKTLTQIELKELLELGTLYSSFYLTEGITKLGFDTGNPNYAML